MGSKVGARKPYQREGIGAQGKTHNSNSKQRKFQIRGVVTR